MKERSTRHLGLAAVAWVALTAVAQVGEAGAHPLAPALYELRELGRGEVAVRFKRPRGPAGGTRLEPVLPAGCAVLDRGAEAGEAGSWVETWRLRCVPPGLAGRSVTVAGLERDGRVVLRVQKLDGTVVRGLLAARALHFRIPERESPAQVMGSYGSLGLWHILSGLDHLFFVFGLVLLAGSARRLLLTVTAFTLGHSVTLGLAALGRVGVASAPVEVGIAASLLYLAVELARKGPERSSFSAPLAAAFGLLHGLGFAGALREVGLPASAVPLALFAFNVGIELGQLTFIGLLLAVWVGVARVGWHLGFGLQLGAGGSLEGEPRFETLPHPARIAVAYALGTAASFWIFERIAALA